MTKRISMHAICLFFALELYTAHRSPLGYITLENNTQESLYFPHRYIIGTHDNILRRTWHPLKLKPQEHAVFALLSKQDASLICRIQDKHTIENSFTFAYWHPNSTYTISTTVFSIYYCCKKDAAMCSTQ